MYCKVLLILIIDKVMKKIYIKIIFLISGIIIYDYLFWKQKLGVNILISSLILLLFLFADNPLKKISKFAIITGTGTIISAGMVMINNSVASVFAFITSFIVFTGFWYYRDIRSILAALPSGVLNFFVAPKQLLNTTKQFVSLPKNAGKILRIFRLTIIPIVVLITFYIIFSIANPKFNDLMVKLFEDLFLFFLNFLFPEYCLLLFLIMMFLQATSLLTNNLMLP